MNSVICIYPPPGTVKEVEVTTIYGKKWKFEFEERFGPLFIGKNGMPLVNQPKVASAAARAFALANFGWDEPIRQIYKLYSSLI